MMLHPSIICEDATYTKMISSIYQGLEMAVMGKDSIAIVVILDKCMISYVAQMFPTLNNSAIYNLILLA